MVIQQSSDPEHRPLALPARSMLAVFLVLCALFAGLIATARPDPGRAAPLLQSLRHAFAARPAPAPTTDARSETAFHAAMAALDRWRERSTGTSPQDDLNAPWRLELAAEALFEGDPIRLRRDRLVLLGRLGELLSALGQDDAGLVLRVFAPPTGDAPRRLELIATALATLDAPLDRIVLGLGGRSWSFDLLRNPPVIPVGDDRIGDGPTSDDPASDRMVSDGMVGR